MKKLYTLLFLMSVSLIGLSQNGAIDARLKSNFTEKELAEMQLKNPANLEYLNFYVANAYEVTPMPSGKGAAHEIKGTIKIVDLNSVNIYELKLFPLQKDYQYYKIEGTDKLLVIISDEQLKAKYNQIKKK